MHPSLPDTPESLSDRDLLSRMHQLVRRERELLTEILHHLKEVERRKLFSDLGFRSLFDYAVRELGYSEGQAGRRIAAMKLLREMPQQEAQELEKKIESGALNLTHLCQAQSFFNEVKKSAPTKTLDVGEKLDVLKGLEHKSSRQGQVALIEKLEAVGIRASPPREQAKILSSEQTELRLVLSAQLLAQLEEVRALLGPKGLGMSWAELIQEMAILSLSSLMDKKFGKRRNKKAATHCDVSRLDAMDRDGGRMDRDGGRDEEALKEDAKNLAADGMPLTADEGAFTTAPSRQGVKNGSKLATREREVTKELESRSELSYEPKTGPKPRSISKGKRYRIWKRDGGACVKCGSKRGLQVDHIVPVAHGGGCEEENLRILCGGCNVREGVKSFGLEKMRR